MVSVKPIPSIGYILEIFALEPTNILSISVLQFANSPPIMSSWPYFAGEKIPFLKRAQLLVADCNVMLKRSDSTTGGTTENTSIIAEAIGENCNLTAFADYKLPQILRYYGVINYSRALAEMIDNRTEIVSGSTV